MTETPSLDELVEKAAARHNGASGRRLAEIAQKAGYEVSHATLNRIRRGSYTSTPTDQTLRAIAYLAGVEEDVAFKALASQHENTAQTATLYFDWARLQMQAKRLTYEYAHIRGIEPDDAEEELAEIFEMDQARRQGRPWTPPWDPGPEYGENDTPWLSSWWQPESKLVDLGYGGRFAGMKVHQVSLPRWMHDVGTDLPQTDKMVGHVLGRHRGARDFAMFLDNSGGKLTTVVFLAVDDPRQFNAATAQEDLQAFMGDERMTFELIVLDELPVTPDGKLNLPRLRALREEGSGSAGPREPVFIRSRMQAAMHDPESDREPEDEHPVDVPNDDFEGR